MLLGMTCISRIGCNHCVRLKESSPSSVMVTFLGYVRRLNWSMTNMLNVAGTNLTNLACDFGAIDPLQGLGLQIAALSDTDPHYAGSCGYACFLANSASLLGDA